MKPGLTNCVIIFLCDRETTETKVDGQEARATRKLGGMMRVQIVLIGEAEDTLDVMLDKIATFYEEL